MMNGVYDDRLQEPTPRSQRYGWFRFKPNFLQVLNRIQWYLAVLFAARALHTGVGDGLIGVIISTIERRFGLSSAQSSWIVGVYDLSALFTVLLFTSLGSRYNRPIVLAAGTLSIGLGCFAFLLPHMVLPDYVPAGLKEDILCDANTTGHGMCYTDENNVTTSVTLSGTKAALAVLIISRMFMGGGYPCLNIQAVTYLDDFVSKGNFALYSGILGAAGLIGPTLAYVCGSLTLKLYTYFYSDEASNLGFDTSDARWVGAWWLGFVVAGIILILIAVAFLGFPRSLPVPVVPSNGQTEINQTPAESAANSPTHSTGKRSKKYFWQKKLARSYQFWGIQVFNFLMKLIANGLAAYGPKYIETQFNLDPADAGLIAGAALVPGGTIGFLAGGAIIKRWKLNCKSVLRLQTLFTIPLPFLYAIFIFNCKTDRYAGAPVSHLNEWFPTTVHLSNSTQSCLELCNCVDVPFTPVCGANEVQYYSACHAGCSDVTYDDLGIKSYANCTCLDTNMTAQTTATMGACGSQSCYLLPAFLCVACLLFILSCAAASMYQVALMRVIVPSERSDALGISAAALCVGGMVGPLFFGFVFDDACDLWDYHCGERGVCLSYNRSRLGYNMFYLSMTVSILSVIGSAVAWYSYEPPEGSDEDVDHTHSQDDGIESNGNKKSTSTTPIYKKSSPEEVDIDHNGTLTQLLPEAIGLQDVRTADC